MYQNFRFFIFKNEIFASVIFKTEVVQFSLHIRDAICKLANEWVRCSSKNASYMTKVKKPIKSRENWVGYNKI